MAKNLSATVDMSLVIKDTLLAVKFEPPEWLRLMTLGEIKVRVNPIQAAAILREQEFDGVPDIDEIEELDILGGFSIVL